MAERRPEPVVRRWPGWPDLPAIQAAAPRQFPFLLDSSGGPAALARYSLLLFCPTAEPDLKETAGEPFLAALDRAFADAGGVPPGTASGASPLPFGGGWFVYLGYELAASIEPGLALPAAAGAAGRLPVAAAWRCPAALVLDHRRRQAMLVAEHPDALEQAAAGLAAAEITSPPLAELPPFALVMDPPERFLAGVGRIHDYLAAGDVFQVNLSRRWHLNGGSPVDPHAVYRRLRLCNPAPFAGCCRIGASWLLSSSPERLLKAGGGEVVTRPIAGTYARTPHSADDQARSAALRRHPKERAEHIMLIDLERNDLGRVCVPGSVRVAELLAVESYAHVHHLVSAVRGRLPPAATPGRIIGAVFPGGTITGCPKVRCMEIIAELEGDGRGYYTGAMGYLGRDGNMELNILIRSMLVTGHGIEWRTGAGIVADSHPASELAETQAKARGLLAALGLAGDRG